MKAFYMPACALLLLGCNETREQDSTSTTPTQESSTPAGEQDPNTISFTKVKRAPGDVFRDTERMTMNMTSTFTVDGSPPQELEISSAKNEIKELTILEATAGSISKVQLKVIEKEDTQKTELVGSKAPAQEEKETSPLTGKTLLLSRQGGEIIVTDEAGNPVDEVTREAALEETDNTFNKDEPGLHMFHKLIPDRPVKLGETFNLKGQEAIEILGKDDGTIKEASFSFTLKERVLMENREYAKFDATMLMKGGPQTGELVETSMKGFLLLDTATCWQTQHKWNGTVTMEASGEIPQGTIVSKGTGTMTMEMEATYSKK
ncbi:MAG: hypothetical protein QF405_05225 [Roseibacillus sp.]|jgi:hypothetical protein|nr:hypothetical protein [Roseibacillus sp.]MDP7307024.1 hypothetical protein [Roseibacillus sp.]|tara:strand:+ start:1770 stop:2726 length:957 start_codon:yes stop_codon:yes gene_type:complete